MEIQDPEPDFNSGIVRRTAMFQYLPVLYPIHLQHRPLFWEPRPTGTGNYRRQGERRSRELYFLRLSRRTGKACLARSGNIRLYQLRRDSSLQHRGKTGQAAPLLVALYGDTAFVPPSLHSESDSRLLGTGQPCAQLGHPGGKHSQAYLRRDRKGHWKIDVLDPKIRHIARNDSTWGRHRLYHPGCGRRLAGKYQP